MLNNTKSLITSFTDNAVKNKTFIIPPYQRLYAWKDEQIKALLDDFKNCIEHNKNQKSHFIGNIVVSENDGKYILIDGQQRLTTIWLVLRYLLRKNFKAKDYFGIEMPIREEDIKAINNYCDNKKSLDECFNEKNNTNVGFKNAFKTFEVYFGKNNKENKEFKQALQENFINFIKEKVKFNLVILSKQVELNKYFVRMNNTGVQLDGTDILKARLLKLISDKDKSKVTEYARIFDECSQMNYFSDFSKNYENTSGEVPTINNIIDNAKKIQNYSNNDNNRAEFKSIIDFPTFVLHVFKILSRQELKEEPNKKIFKEKAQISIKKDKFLENTWDKLNDRLNAEQAQTIIDALKEYRTIFDTFVIKRKADDDDENIYKLWNKNNNWNEVSEANDLATIQNYLRVARRGDNANYHYFLTHYLEFCKNEIMSKEEISRDNCLAKLKDSKNADNLRNYLKSIDDFLALKQFEMANDLNKTTNLIDEINAINFGDTISIKDSLNDINENKFSFLNYSNRGNHKVNLTYWFHRLEYYLLIGDYHTNQELGADFKEKFESYKNGYYFRNINSVEHILAQHEEDQNNNKITENDLHSFGNLALISSSENSSLSNQGYEKKRIDFNKNKIISLKLFDVFENKKYKDGDKNQWLSRQIQDHQKAMLEVLQKSFDSQKNLK
ncbi:DUF262 domain-containing protein [Campylobacter sp. Cr9]|uniref:DUF262 domain-containing protein n=1 Tax=Campylobacter sp. Cr9 TaxID=2735728 RepID=UPI00301510CD|nr:DUF262 domain-containing protein [Campylobacter sp. Cr9]